MVRALLSLICLSLLGLSLAHAATLEAEVDRTQLTSKQHLLLTLKLFNSDTRLRAEGVKPNIDLTLLADQFDIGKPEVTNHYNVYQGQGRARSELKVELFPKHSGKLTIPPFTVDGVSSQAITLEVLPPSTDQLSEIFAEVGSNLETVWAGQQLVIYLDLYHRVKLDKAAMGDMPKSEPIDWDLLQNWKLPQATRIENRDGFEYEVERIAWAVYPDQAGALTITLPDLWITTQDGRQQRLPFKSQTFNIKALPEGLPNNLIIGKPELTLKQGLGDGVRTNVLNQWSVTLRAPVPVTSLPQYLPEPELPNELKLYMDAADYKTEFNNDGIIDHANYTLSIMPFEPGNYELPPIRIPYFDTERGVTDVVELAGQKITVTGAPVPRPESEIVEQLQSLGTPTESQNSNLIWQTTTALFATLWLITLYLWRRRASTKTPATETTIPKSKKELDRRPPLQQQLLAALKTQTLEEGLQHTDDSQVVDTIRAVQRHFYGESDIAESELQKMVDEACQRLKQASNKNKQDQRADWQQQAMKPTAR